MAGVALLAACKLPVVGRHFLKKKNYWLVLISIKHTWHYIYLWFIWASHMECQQCTTHLHYILSILHIFSFHLDFNTFHAFFNILSRLQSPYDLYLTCLSNFAVLSRRAWNTRMLWPAKTASVCVCFALTNIELLSHVKTHLQSTYTQHSYDGQ